MSLASHLIGACMTIFPAKASPYVTMQAVRQEIPAGIYHLEGMDVNISYRDESASTAMVIRFGDHSLYVEAPVNETAPVIRDLRFENNGSVVKLTSKREQALYVLTTVVGLRFNHADRTVLQSMWISQEREMYVFDGFLNHKPVKVMTVSLKGKVSGFN